MKLFSTNRNSRGRQLLCEDAVFDPNLIMASRVDVEEKVVSFSYDFTECGHPLNLPFNVQSVDFIVKFTKHDIHICAIAEVGDDIGEQYEDYIDDMQDICFDVRMKNMRSYLHSSMPSSAKQTKKKRRQIKRKALPPPTPRIRRTYPISKRLWTQWRYCSPTSTVTI